MLDNENNDIFIHMDKKSKNYDEESIEKLAKKSIIYHTECKLCLNGMPVPLLRNCYSIFNGTKYR